MPIFLSLFLLFCLWLHYEKWKSNRLHKKTTETFLEQEREANLSRKKDISSLPYLRIPEFLFTLQDTASISSPFLARLSQMQDKKMVDLSGLSNTQLKEQYGIANFERLSEYDENHYQYVTLLDEWATCLYEAGQYNDAQKLLEYVCSLPSEISNSYRILGELYLETNNLNGFFALLDQVGKHPRLRSSQVYEELSKRSLMVTSSYL